MKLAYMTYPLTGAPEKYTKEAKALALKILKARPDIVIVFAHVTVDSWIPPKLMRRRILADIELIHRSDFIIEGKELDYEESAGAVWEHCIAMFNNKPIYTPAEIIEGKDRA